MSHHVALRACYHADDVTASLELFSMLKLEEIGQEFESLDNREWGLYYGEIFITTLISRAKAAEQGLDPLIITYLEAIVNAALTPMASPMCLLLRKLHRLRSESTHHLYCGYCQ